MSAPPGPVPDERSLADTPLHVLVADYPETLALLRNLGIGLDAAGARVLSEVVDEKGLNEIAGAIAWRRARAVAGS